MMITRASSHFARTALVVASAVALVTVAPLSALATSAISMSATISGAVTARITVGSGCWLVAVNETTNTIYVPNQNDGNVSVIDGATDTVTSTITVGTNPNGVAVDATTNTIYVSNLSDNTVSVIDGATAAVTSTITVGTGPEQIAVDETTNTIYVTNFGDGSVSVIDGATAAVTSTVTVGDGPWGVAVNETTNTVYVANNFDDSVSVIDGASGTVTSTILVGDSPYGAAVNATTDTIYITNRSADSVSVIDGGTAEVTSTIAVGSGTHPEGVAVDPTTNTIYVAKPGDASVSVIDGATAAVSSTIASGGAQADGVAVNATTQKVYVTTLRSDEINGKVSVISMVSEDRLSGSDRYATSAAISAATFSPGVSAVLIANGQNFPDALSGAPVGGLAGVPILLVSNDSIPAVIQAELTRLNPANITVLGGTGVVSNSVKTALAAYTSGTVTRVAGADRYATSATISAAQFSPGVSVAYIASGLTFPDALSGAPVAGMNDSPVLLVSPTSIPAVTQTELARLNPAKIVVLGGTGVVSESVKTALAAYTPGTVTRLAGANRYATSAAISAANFSPGAPVVYIASGLSFPDALSGAPVAGMNGAPVLLVSATSIPAEIKAELTRLQPGRVIILGGTGVVSHSVAAQLATYIVG